MGWRVLVYFVVSAALAGLAPTLAHSALPLNLVDGQPLPTLAPMLEKVRPSVVNIATYTTVRVRNPLLEDVNLQGARGILVNITAGPDLSLGEYSDVGSIIEAFASEHAMVKVGTVIDPDMRDELHVTVVATGLGAKIEKPVKVIDNTLHNSQASHASQAAAAPAPARHLRGHGRSLLHTRVANHHAPFRLAVGSQVLPDLHAATIDHEDGVALRSGCGLGLL